MICTIAISDIPLHTPSIKLYDPTATDAERTSELCSTLKDSCRTNEPERIAQNEVGFKVALGVCTISG